MRSCAGELDQQSVFQFAELVHSSAVKYLSIIVPQSRSRTSVSNPDDGQYACALHKQHLVVQICRRWDEALAVYEGIGCKLKHSYICLRIV
jgi:hypothetical protein